MGCGISRLAVAAGLSAMLGACATAEVEPGSGFSTAYEGLEPRTDVVRASVAQRRDEALDSLIGRIWLAPAEVFGVTDPVLSQDERHAVLKAVNRQLCYELSERFEVSGQPDPLAGTVRVGVSGRSCPHRPLALRRRAGIGFANDYADVSALLILRADRSRRGQAAAAAAGPTGVRRRDARGGDADTSGLGIGLVDDGEPFAYS